jgi:hypothetical protein
MKGNQPANVGQDHEHLLVCPDMDKTCSWLDLKEPNDEAIYVADYWKNNV